MDVSVITSNFKFLILQGLIGIGPFIGGTLRLAIPAILFGFVLGIFVGLARLAQAPWLPLPPTPSPPLFPRAPLALATLSISFIIPHLLPPPIPPHRLAPPPL